MKPGENSQEPSSISSCACYFFVSGPVPSVQPVFLHHRADSVNWFLFRVTLGCIRSHRMMGCMLWQWGCWRKRGVWCEGSVRCMWRWRGKRWIGWMWRNG